MKKITLPVLIAILAIFVRCDDDHNNGNPNSMTVIMDGTELRVSQVRGTLYFMEIQFHEFTGLLISGKIDGNHFSIRVQNWDFQNPPHNAVFTKDYFNIFFGDRNLEGTDCLTLDGGNKLCEWGYIEYHIDDGTWFGETYFSRFDDSIDAFIKITSCDGERASGEFQAKMVSDKNNELVLSGTFNSLYEIRDKI